MTSHFLLPFSRFNLAFLFFEKQKKILKKYSLLETKAVQMFEYRENNNKY